MDTTWQEETRWLKRTKKRRPEDHRAQLVSCRSACTLAIGILIEEQSKDTDRHKGTKQAEEMKMSEPKDRQDHSACHQVAHHTA
uniref:Uncharacterized protein n=1 Tax=Solanum tuberosum TaxID=4113 RepID=M1D930_SOLTU